MDRPFGIGEEYRLNSPGEGGQWLNRLPREVTLENLLKAAKNEPAPEAAAEAVTLIRELTAKGGRTAQAPGWELKIAHVIPEVGGEVIQIREVGQSFLVDAYVEGNPEKVILVLTEPGGNQEKQIELQSSHDNAAGERNGLPGRWRANVPADRVGQWDFYVEAQGADGNREQSGIGRLVTVAHGADLNPLSKGYVLSPAPPAGDEGRDGVYFRHRE